MDKSVPWLASVQRGRESNRHLVCTTWLEKVASSHQWIQMRHMVLYSVCLELKAKYASRPLLFCLFGNGSLSGFLYLLFTLFLKMHISTKKYFEMYCFGSWLKGYLCKFCKVYKRSPHREVLFSMSISFAIQKFKQTGMFHRRNSKIILCFSVLCQLNFVSRGSNVSLTYSTLQAYWKSLCFMSVAEGECITTSVRRCFITSAAIAAAAYFVQAPTI